MRDDDRRQPPPGPGALGLSGRAPRWRVDPLRRCRAERPRRPPRLRAQPRGHRGPVLDRRPRSRAATSPRTGRACRSSWSSPSRTHAPASRSRTPTSRSGTATPAGSTPASRAPRRAAARARRPAGADRRASATCAGTSARRRRGRVALRDDLPGLVPRAHPAHPPQGPRRRRRRAHRQLFFPESVTQPSTGGRRTARTASPTRATPPTGSTRRPGAGRGRRCGSGRGDARRTQGATAACGRGLGVGPTSPPKPAVAAVARRSACGRDRA